MSLGDAVEREEHADVDGTASKKTSPSVAQRSKEKKKKQTKIYYVHITSEKMVGITPSEGRNPAERSTKHLIFVFLEKDETFFFYFWYAQESFFLLFNVDVVNKATGSSSSGTLCDTG